jgi:hypothetical protein
VVRNARALPDVMSAPGNLIIKESSEAAALAERLRMTPLLRAKIEKRGTRARTIRCESLRPARAARAERVGARSVRIFPDEPALKRRRENLDTARVLNRGERSWLPDRDVEHLERRAFDHALLLQRARIRQNFENFPLGELTNSANTPI